MASGMLLSNVGMNYKIARCPNL